MICLIDDILMQTLELQQTTELLRSEQSKTEKLQGFLEHAESDVEQLTNQAEEYKDLISSLEAEKNANTRQLQGAKTGEESILLPTIRVYSVYKFRATKG
jgi:peptidoglycan hydrolase CwlO-like protein